jgi:hypothetical protein
LAFTDPSGEPRLYLIGSAKHNDHLAETGHLEEEAIVNTLLLVKVATNRERPTKVMAVVGSGLTARVPTRQTVHSRPAMQSQPLPLHESSPLMCPSMPCSWAPTHLPWRSANLLEGNHVKVRYVGVTTVAFTIDLCGFYIEVFDIWDAPGTMNHNVRIKCFLGASNLRMNLRTVAALLNRSYFSLGVITR